MELLSSENIKMNERLCLWMRHYQVTQSIVRETDIYQIITCDKGFLICAHKFMWAEKGGTQLYPRGRCECLCMRKNFTRENVYELSLGSLTRLHKVDRDRNRRYDYREVIYKARKLRKTCCIWGNNK